MEKTMHHRKNLTVVLLLLVSTVHLDLAQNAPCTITWDTIQQISYDSCYSIAPHIVAVGDTLHLLWLNTPIVPAPDSQQGVFYLHSFNNGISYSAPFKLAPLADQEGLVAIDRGNFTASGKYLYWVFGGERFDIPPYWYWMAFRKSSDAGISWGDIWMFNEASPYNAAALDSSLYIIYGDADTIAGHIRDFSDCLTSHNYGESFTQTSDHIPVNGGWNTFIASPHALNYFYCNSSSLGFSEILHARSLDRGISWSAVDTLSTIDLFHSQHPSVATDNNGNMYLVWYDFKYGSVDMWHGSVLLRKSTDDGATWEDEQDLTYTPSGILPRIAVHDNIVAVIWNDYIDNYNDRSILRVSFNGGKTWGDTIAVNANGGDVDVAITHNRIFCTWYYGLDIYLRKGEVSSGCYPFTKPSRFALNQNYPNPFNGTTTISYDLPELSFHVALTIYNILGQKMSTIVNIPDQAAGHYEVRWDAANHPSGVYFYKLESEKFSETKKFVILK
jgi:hypothetical protein